MRLRLIVGITPISQIWVPEASRSRENWTHSFKKPSMMAQVYDSGTVEAEI